MDYRVVKLLGTDWISQVNYWPTFGDTVACLDEIVHPKNQKHWQPCTKGSQIGREDKKQEVEGKEEKEVDYGLLQGHMVHIPFFLANRLSAKPTAI